MSILNTAAVSVTSDGSLETKYYLFFVETLDTDKIYVAVKEKSILQYLKCHGSWS